MDKDTPSLFICPPYHTHGQIIRQPRAPAEVIHLSNDPICDLLRWKLDSGLQRVDQAFQIEELPLIILGIAQTIREIDEQIAREERQRGHTQWILLKPS
jgi:hypothetical protein